MDFLTHRTDIVWQNIGSISLVIVWLLWPQSFLYLWPLIKFEILVPYAHSSTSSLPLFMRVKILRGAGSISLGSKEATTTGYRGPFVTVFLNRTFLLFSAPATENYGDQILWNICQGSLSPDYFRKSYGYCFQVQWCSWLSLCVPHQPFNRFPTPCLT